MNHIIGHANDISCLDYIAYSSIDLGEVCVSDFVLAVLDDNILPMRGVKAHILDLAISNG